MIIDNAIICLAILLLLDIDKRLFVALLAVTLVYTAMKQNEAFSSPTPLPPALSQDNPFGNTLPLETPKDPDEEERNFFEDNQETTIRALYNENIFRPLEDYFDKRSGFRQFYRTPDVSGFINTVYRNQPSCKDDPFYCVNDRIPAVKQ